jgi:hypothetical protein
VGHNSIISFFHSLGYITFSSCSMLCIPPSTRLCLYGKSLARFYLSERRIPCVSSGYKLMEGCMGVA